MAGRLCTVEGCGRRHYGRGYCLLHWSRVRRTGEPGPVGLIPARPAKPYRRIHAAGHPLARAQGLVYEHRVVLFDAIGPGQHPCHWCGRSVSWTAKQPGRRLNVDHLDHDGLNNAPENLVPACLRCNTTRKAAA